MELIVDKQSEAFELNEEQEQELINMTGDFLLKHFSKEILSTLIVDIKISLKPEAELSGLTFGCVFEQGADDPRCPPNYAWKRR
jgi:hypothetical protein